MKVNFVGKAGLFKSFLDFSCGGGWVVGWVVGWVGGWVVRRLEGKA